MLILIAGITGGMGRRLAHHALERGHAVRGLARSKSKVSETLALRLESLQIYNNFDDVPMLDNACAGVDAIVCAYAVEPRQQLDGQLLLLRAAERAGVQKFVAASWNADYRWLSLGDHECYGPYICFCAQAELTSSIKPIYMMTGAFPESLFSAGQTVMMDQIDGMKWSPARGQVATWGTGDEVITCTPMDDAAAYTIRVLEHGDAKQGGDWRVTSFSHSIKDMIDIYRAVTGTTLKLYIQGSIEDLKRLEASARTKGSKQNYWEYAGYSFAKFNLDGTFERATDDRTHEFPDIPRTSLADWFCREDLGR